MKKSRLADGWDNNCVTAQLKTSKLNFILKIGIFWRAFSKNF